MADGIVAKFLCRPQIVQRDASQAEAARDGQQITTLTDKLKAANLLNTQLEQDDAGKGKTIAQQADAIQTQQGQISDLTAKNASLSAQVGSSQNLFLKPCPALLVEVPASKVMLGQCVIETMQGTQYLDYPTHPSIFTPSPIYEGTLDAADCNRFRTDLQTSEINIKIANVEQKGMRYMPDQQQYGAPDCWMLGVIAKMLGQDDCETLATNILNAIFYREIKWGAYLNHSAFLGLGHIKEGVNSYGHGFVVLLHNTSTDLKDSYIIEATLNFEAAPMTLQDAKSTYDIDWGLIGWVRKDHPEGTYQMSTTYNWWGTSGASRPGCNCWRCTKDRPAAKAKNLLMEIESIFSKEPTEDEKKMAIIREKWEPNRIRKQGAI